MRKPRLRDSNLSILSSLFLSLSLGGERESRPTLVVPTVTPPVRGTRATRPFPHEPRVRGASGKSSRGAPHARPVWEREVGAGGAILRDRSAAGVVREPALCRVRVVLR